jgi:succinoglycan biosynthesis protein ExoV
VIITEAMHGAIVADTYNIPWIPVFTYASFNFFKWNDWAASLDMSINFKKLPRIYKGEKGLKVSLKKVIFRYLLKKISKSKTYLSSDYVKHKRRSQLKLRIDEFKKDYNIT